MVSNDPYASDEAISDTSCEYDDFKISCGESIKIFNGLMRPRKATQCYDALPQIFNKAYPFKRSRVLSTLGVIRPKNGKGHATIMIKNFNSKDLRANPL